MENQLTRFGKYIGGKRTALNKQFEEIAYKVGVSAGTVRRWESGKSYPRANKLAPLAKVLGVTLEELTSTLATQEASQ